MDQSTLTLSFYNDEEDTQVVVADEHDNYSTAEQTDKMESVYPADSMKTVEDNSDNFSLPDIDDENDDFSWLFKVLPQETSDSDQAVPNDQSPSSFKQKNHQITKHGTILPQESTLIDNVFSEMDVTSLVLLNDSNLELNTPTENTELQENQRKQSVRRSSRRVKRPTFLRVGSNGTITDTPVSLRRTQRKRSYQQMIANISNAEVNDNIKRRRVQDTQSESTPNSYSYESPNEIKPPKEIGIKIIFRKHKPVNPIDISLINDQSYQKGLLDPRIDLAGELYLKHSMLPQVVPKPLLRIDGIVPSIMVDKPLEPEKIKKLLKIKWIDDQNIIANAKAHGKEALGNIKLTPNGEAIQGGFTTIDLDQQYENLLQEQNSFQTVLNWKEKVANLQTIHPEIEKCVNLENTFSDFSNFNNYFDDELNKNDYNNGKGSRDKLCCKVTGAIPVNKFATSKGSAFYDKLTLFRLKGQYFRLNPVVVNIQRLPDYIIEEATAKPKKITAESTYYNAITSYFDKRAA